MERSKAFNVMTSNPATSRGSASALRIIAVFPSGCGLPRSAKARLLDRFAEIAAPPLRRLHSPDAHQGYGLYSVARYSVISSASSSVILEPCFCLILSTTALHARPLYELFSMFSNP